MGSPFACSLETLQRFDKPGPRYTSYPTAVEFNESVAESAYREALAQTDAANPEAPLSLYAHLPFCEHRCLFCGCHVVITRHKDVAAQYLDHIKHEIDLVAGLLPRRRKVVQMHWGGGTPTYFSPQQLQDLFEHIRHHFHFQPDAEIALEVDPCVTSFEHLDVLSSLGFNRLSMGVQDFTPGVQQAIERIQSFEETRDLMQHARRVGFSEGINIDLIYGLPEQKLDEFRQSIDQVIALRPDRVALYSFAYVPWIRGHQRMLDTSVLPPPELKLALYLMAMERFVEAGYQPIGMDHFALETDELAVATREGRLRRNFMGYTVQPASDMLAFGISGIGETQQGFFQNEKKLSTYYEALEQDRIPVQRGYLLDEDDRIRQYVIAQLMCNFKVKKAEVNQRFGIDFDAYFASSLAQLGPLKEEGFLIDEAEAVTVTEAGRLFVRNACMAFDRYLAAKSQDKPIFSRTV